MMRPSMSPGPAGLAAVALTAATLVGAVASTTASAASSCRPAIRNLGDPLGGHFSFADGVNSHGDVAGTAALPDGRGRAVVWHAGSATNLGVVAPYDESFAHDIGEDGTVVGELNYRQKKAAAFIYSHGRLRKLPTLGGDFSYADAVNARGNVVGTASDGTGRPHAVVWTDDGRRVHDLGIARGDVASFGTGINDASTVAGDTDSADQNQRAAIFDHRGTVVLSAISGRFSTAEDIDNAGRVVGYSDALGGRELHATVWGAFRSRGRDLGTLPGGDFSNLLDVDDRGRGAGGGNLANSPDQVHAIVWPGSGASSACRHDPRAPTG